MITEKSVKDFLKNASEEYVKIYEDRFQKVAKKAFLDGMYNMAGFIESDGDYQLEWGDPEDFRAIKLRNDIDNAVGQPMTLNQYQGRAMSTCMSSCSNFSYMMLNLVGEVGEFASKVAKEIRKGNIEIGATAMPNKIMPYMNEDEWWAKETELMMEAGDILWQLAGLCTTMGWTLEEIAQRNLDKLSSRKKRGVIDGDGDNR
jgi:NTP pyrophosphatase (non-canonical NTP hydrolase)